jgi:hypothetical protein
MRNDTAGLALGRFLSALRGLLLLVGVLPACASALAAPEPLLRELRVLSAEWVCGVVDPTGEILQHRDKIFAEALEKDRAEYAKLISEGKKGWYLEKSQHYRTLLVQNTLHRELFADLNRAAFWKLNGEEPRDVTVWAHSVDGMPAERASDAPALESTPLSRIADMVYLKLARPLKSGAVVSVRGGERCTGTLSFDEEATVCWSLKVNQVGYRPGDPSNRAYLGMWLPGIGPLDFSAYEGKPFFVRRYLPGEKWNEGRATGKAVLEGTIALRRRFDQQEVTREGGSNATGEDVYEMDLSKLSSPGDFCIQIPGLGRSWPFRVGPNVFGEAYFTTMKGLFTQRCGMALTKPFSAWERDACHTKTLPGRFPPETEGWYRNAYRKGDAGVGFRDASGNAISLSAFTLVGNCDETAPPLPGVRGGWHDAADFDRRIHHYNVVWDLLAALEANPRGLTDNQLNIPESANGVPDVLDEALWGLDVWTRTQNPDGGVSSWIEQKSHPATAETLAASISKDPLTMFASLPDRTGSFAYAAAAAWAGRLLLPYDPERAGALIQSAARAFEWAEQDKNAIRNWRMEIVDGGRDSKLKGQTIQFDEDPSMRPEDNVAIERSFAALHLFQATGRPAYKQTWLKSAVASDFHRFVHRVNPCRLLPLLKNAGHEVADHRIILETLVRQADALLTSQEENAYRMLWLSPKDGWFHTLAWGNFHSKLRLLGIVASLTGDPRHKNALASGASFFLGCNPLGTTLVSGLGSVFPVVFQHIHSQSDGLAEPTPGIAPYFYTFGVPMTSFLLADSGHASVRSFFKPVALALIPDRLGRVTLQEKLDQAEKSGDWVREAGKPVRDVVWKNWPVFRRHTTHPAAVVEQNEFTVGETISPLAFCFAVLTGEGWTPSRELLRRTPRKHVSELPYYSQP